MASGQKNRKGHKNFAPIPLYSTWKTTEIGGVKPVVPRGQSHLPTTNRTMGNPVKLQDGVPVIMKVIDLMPCREADGDGRILLMFQAA